MLSPRDLPLWARGAFALLLVLLGWYAGHTSLLVSVAGDSVVELSAGGVALVVVLVWRMPTGWWPRSPRRPVFSPIVALVVAILLGLGVVAGTDSAIATRFWETGRGAVLAVVGGAVVWSVGWGRIRHEAFGRWFALAAAGALGPVSVALVITHLAGRLPPLEAVAIPGMFSYALVLTATAALVTQELAFRRLLVGQSGDAGVLVVLGAAVVAAGWHATIPQEGAVWMSALGGFLNAVALGGLYVLSRSLFVSATFHAVQLASVTAVSSAGATITETTGLGQRFWTAHLIGVGLVGAGLAYHVFRQNGWIGALPGEGGRLDAPGD